jgi:hypothetical protein
MSNNSRCFLKKTQSKSAVIKKLQPATKYFVTVSAITRMGYNKKSAEKSKITNGGEYSALLSDNKL